MAPDAPKRRNQEQLRAYLDQNEDGVTAAGIARLLNNAGLKKKPHKGRKSGDDYSTKDISQMALRSGPDENVVAILDENYPDWRLTKTDVKIGRHTTAKKDEKPPIRLRRMPVISSIADAKMSHDLQEAKADGWEGETIDAPDFLGIAVPLQPVTNVDYAPAFIPGDYVALLPNASAHVGRVFAVTELASGKPFYAALMLNDGSADWQLYSGEYRSFNDFAIDAAVVVLLPQYQPGNPDAFYGPRGLKVGVHVAWPKKI